MSLRTRLAVLTAVAVAVAVVLVAGFAFISARRQMRDSVDDFLRAQAPATARNPRLAQIEGSTPTFAGVDTFVQLLDENGRIAGPSQQGHRLPVDDVDLAVASGDRRQSLRDVEVDGEHLRMITVEVADRNGGPGPGPGPSGLGGDQPQALQLARSLEEVDDSLQGLGLALAGAAVAGAAIAAGAGLLIARRALRPVAELTTAAEHVADTQDLGASIESRGQDELGRLADSFNAMLGALADSRNQQRQLVDDASHELRTPLTSLRTNIELLQRAGSLPEDEQERILDDAVGELAELTALVGELVDLASDAPRVADERQDVRLDAVVEQAAAKAGRRTGHAIELDLEPTVVEGSPSLLERAVANLLDNACKWSPDGAGVSVRLAGGRLAVRDDGPGIDENDLPRVFDRFYRSPAARSTPGSGLGLAIVRQIVEAHGGTVFAGRAPGGGGEVGFEIPSEPVEGVEAP